MQRITLEVLAMSKRLTVVADDAQVAPKRTAPTRISAAIGSGERDLLLALRALAAAKLDDPGVPAHTIPQLMKQLRELDKDIRALDSREQQESESARSGEAVNDAFDASAI